MGCELGKELVRLVASSALSQVAASRAKKGRPCQKNRFGICCAIYRGAEAWTGEARDAGMDEVSVWGLIVLEGLGWIAKKREGPTWSSVRARTEGGGGGCEFNFDLVTWRAGPGGGWG